MTALNVFIPDLWQRLFVEGYVPPEEVKKRKEDIFYPSTQEDFKAILEALEEEEREQGVFTQRF